MQCDFVKTEFVHTGGRPLCVCARPGCRRHGFSHHPERLKAACMAPTVGIGDAVYVAIKIATLGLVKTCDACLRRKLRLNRYLSWGLPSWIVRLLRLERPLPWDDPAYQGKLQIKKAD